MAKLDPQVDPFADHVTNIDVFTAGPEVFVFRQIFTPFRLARVLIQLGYEPLAPSQSINPLSRLGLRLSPIYCYPNIFVYTRYLFHTRGFWQTISCSFVSRFVFDVATEASNLMCHRYVVDRTLTNDQSLEDDEVLGKPDSMLLECFMEEAPLPRFLVQLLELCFLKAHEVLLTQPFFVIMVRQMASFVGEESGYSWFHQAVYTIYKEGGFGGFFGGITPRLVFELSRLILYTVGCRVLRRLVFNSCPRSTGFLKPLRSLLFMVINLFSYRLEVVSTMMAIRGSRLAAAHAANQVIHWRDCGHALTRQGQDYRGFRPFWRSHVQSIHLPSPVSQPSAN